jgi:hypothetical protein
VLSAWYSLWLSSRYGGNREMWIWINLLAF